MFKPKQWPIHVVAGWVVLACVATGADAAEASEQVVFAPISGRVEYMPVLTNGDSEFGGNGPKVQVYVQFFVQNNTVYRRISMKAQETSAFGNNVVSGKDTWAGGWSRPERVYRPPAGKRIQALRGITEKTAVVNTVMNGHRPKTFTTVVGNVTVWGDRDGKDVGHYTRVVIDFKYDLPVVLKEGWSNRVRVRLPGTFTLMPPHTKGDKDFKGHGPHVKVYAELAHTNEKLFFFVYMQARETKGGTTEAVGYKRIAIYKAPRGFRIKAVHGAQKWPDLVSYVDRDHERDLVSTDLGPAMMFGDRRGDDAGVYTRIVLSNIQHAVTVELEALKL